jgi:hypothetical protein
MEIKKRYNPKAVAFFISFFLLAVLPAGFAQDTASAGGMQRYLKTAFGAGTAKNFGIYFSVLVSEKGFYALDVNHISRKVDAPDGYYGESYVCLLGDCMPRDEISYITLFAGRYFLRKNGFRFGAAAGPSFVNYNKVLFRERQENGMGPNFGGAYYTVNSNRIGGGVGLKTMVEFRIAKGLWLEPAFYANINTQHTIYSGNLFVSFELPLKARNR